MNVYQKLKAEGKTVKEICAITGKAKSVVYDFLDPNGREKGRNRLNSFRQARMLSYKATLGSKCRICGYSRCSEALEFHHSHESLKNFEISDAIYSKVKVTESQLQDELAKCVLLCANCHREIHAGLANLVPA